MVRKFFENITRINRNNLDIWELILDTILEIAEMISADVSELLSAVIDANPKFHKLYQMYILVA